jgi:hypothetical protein
MIFSSPPLELRILFFFLVKVHRVFRLIEGISHLHEKFNFIESILIQKESRYTIHARRNYSTGNFATFGPS